MSEPKILVLSGGLSHERDISLRSGRRVAESLRESGCAVREADLDTSLLPALADDQPDIVWPLLHGAHGEDGSVRDMLELLKLPYIGTNPRASRMAWHKAIAKTIVRRAGLTTPDYITLPQSLFRELGAARMLESIEDDFRLPVVVKPVHGGSAQGVTIVTAPEEFPGAMVDAFAYCETVLIERCVTGVELGVSVIDLGKGPQALPAVEIVTEGPYDFDARYNPGRAEYFAPARLSDEQMAAAAAFAVRVHSTLGLERLSRTDMILDEAGTFWFLEVSIAPGMTETSVFPLAAQAAGYALPDLYRRLAEASITI
jgi:D-alanine-D-alanine ligase